MSKAESALNFIKEQITSNHTVYISTPLRHIRVTPKTFKTWADSKHELFKIDSHGDLLMARGKNYDCIVTKTISLVKITATN